MPRQRYTWHEAKSWLAGIKISGGGWRLPTRDEPDNFVGSKYNTMTVFKAQKESSMTRENAIKRARNLFDSDEFFSRLSALVAAHTGSRADDRGPEMAAYLEQHLAPWLNSLDFQCRLVENPVEVNAPLLIGRRIENPDRPTILIYGHGDTVPAMEGRWEQGLDPLVLTRKDEKWYGRGTADNKGQHAVNIAALECVLREKGKLGFNVIILVETGEESGSPGLHRVCAQEKEDLEADVLIASDGPRIDPATPTIFGGSRAVFNFDLELVLREGGHHSGNWGGLLSNPGIILPTPLPPWWMRRGKYLLTPCAPTRFPRISKRPSMSLPWTEQADRPSIRIGENPVLRRRKSSMPGIPWMSWLLNVEIRPGR